MDFVDSTIQMDTVASTSGGSNDESDGEPLSSTLPAILVGVCGLFGNAFVITVVYKFPKLRRRLTSMFLVNQSIVEMIASGVMVLHYITRYMYSYHVYMDGVAGELYCRLWLTAFPLFGMMLTSTFNLMSITLERYMMVVHPIYHKNTFTRRKALIMITCSWVCGVGYNAFWDPYTTRRRGEMCHVFGTWPNKATAEFYAVLTLLLYMLIPVVLMGFMYTRMIVILHRKPRSNQVGPHENPPNNPPASHISHAQRNLIKTLVVVLAAFIMCWSLNQMYWFLFNFGYIKDPGSDVHTVSVTLVYINCCINPFIYIFKYEEFRRGVRNLFRGPSHHSMSTAGSSTIKTVSNATDNAFKYQERHNN